MTVRPMPAILDADKSGENRIILSSSGMCDVGPIAEHLKRGLSDPRNTVVLTGYQALGSAGSHLLALSADRKKYRDGESVSIGGTAVSVEDVKAEIVDLGRFYSGHADQASLLEFLFPVAEFKEIRPCTVFLNHGTDEARKGLRNVILARADEKREAERPIAYVHLPSRADQWFDLASGRWLSETPQALAGETGPIVKRLDRLIAIGERIVQLLENGKGTEDIK
jgi:metallo-beta-lactamase family protein